MDPLYMVALWLMINSAVVLAVYTVAFLIWELDTDAQLVFQVTVFIPILMSLVPMLVCYRRDMSLTSVMNGEDYDDERDRRTIVGIRKSISHRYRIVIVSLLLIIVTIWMLRLAGIITSDIPHLIVMGPVILIIGIGSLLQENAIRNASLRWTGIYHFVLMTRVPID